MPQDILEPELLPPDHEASSSSNDNSGPRPTRPSLLLAGVLIDAVDFLTIGPTGIRFGFLLGFGASLLALTVLRLPIRTRLQWSLFAGFYCALPLTERLPLASLLSLLMRRR